MFRFAFLFVCFIGVSTGVTRAQNSSIEPVHVAAGTVLMFHLQTRLKPVDGDALTSLPEGTILRVKMLDSVDSGINGDGAEFRGSIVSSLSSGDDVVIHSDAEVRGLLALLRSRSHPEGFRYELLLTGVTERGKSYALTASLSPALFDSGSRSPGKPELKDDSPANSHAPAKLP